MFGSVEATHLLDELMRRIVITVFTGLFSLAITLAVLYILRVKNPKVRYLFFMIPLLKSLTAFIREPPMVADFKGVLIFGFQLPNLRRLLPSLPFDLKDIHLAEHYKASIDFQPAAVAAIFTATSIFLLWRVFELGRFQQALSGASALSRPKHESLFVMLDRLVAISGIPYPKLIVLDSADPPFTVGIRQPVIVLSLPIIEGLTDSELEAVLAHEIAHIARKDHVLHWLLLLLRDTLFFSPVTHWLYRRLSFEKERVCDDYSAGLTAPLVLAGSLVKIAEVKRGAQRLKTLRSFAPQNLLSPRHSSLKMRVKGLVDQEEYREPDSFSWALMTVLAFFWLLVEPHVIVKAHSLTIVLS